MAHTIWNRPLGWKGRAIGGAAAMGFGWSLTLIIGETNWPSFPGVLAFVMLAGAVGGISIDRIPKEFS
jgi:hypothetical protein